MLSKMTTFEMSDNYVMDTYGRFPLELVRGEGCYLYDQEGNCYVDFCAGIATNALGYHHPVLTEALKSQLESLIHVSNLYYTKPQAEAAKLLVENTHFERAFFCNSGTEANEAAIKLARKWGKAQSTQKTTIITMENSFHGRTLGALTATGQEKYQKAFTPLLEGFCYVPFNDLEALKAVVNEQTCAIMIEVIQGEGGIKPIDPVYLAGIKALCDAYNVLLIVDEVQTGIGRCGYLFGYMQHDLQPDIITSAKGLGAGVPIGAMLCNAKANVFARGDHAATFGGNPLSATAATVVLKELLQGGILENVRENGAYLTEALYRLKEKYPLIKEVRGVGYMQAIELTIPARDIMNECIETGLIVVGSGEYVIRLVPPLVMTKEDLKKGLAIIEEALKMAC